MNTLNRDRNTLKRLVESYGKKDVLNFVKHLNEESQIENFVKVFMSVAIDDWIDYINDSYGENIDYDDTLSFTQFLKDNFGIIVRDAFDEVEYHDPGADVMLFIIPINKNAIDFFGEEQLKESIKNYINDIEDDSPYQIVPPTDKFELTRLLRVL